MNKIVIYTCKIGQGSECCKYLMCGSKGFECMKLDINNKKMVDEHWLSNPHVAQGDNCEGQELTN